ncbi:hypothetical protein [Flavobacterium sp. T12S277]|uniref:hypothetical protein n=1 Tax=Flavobacterium sp. T12S277 TaxID=3402752 RepID=UPI003AD84C6E
MTADQILSAIGLVGFGGILKVFFDFLVATRKAKQDAKQTMKETRYKAIILLCYALVNYEKEKTTLVINRPDINSFERLKNELYAEFINMSLFASDKVLIELKRFIHSQNSERLNDLVLAMRKDLFGIKTNLKSNHFNIEL